MGAQSSPKPLGSPERMSFRFDNFLKNKKIGEVDKGKVLSVKYSDCGVLDPWNLKDPI
jgi:hypothetical protein